MGEWCECEDIWQSSSTATSGAHGPLATFQSQPDLATTSCDSLKIETSITRASLLHTSAQWTCLQTEAQRNTTRRHPPLPLGCHPIFRLSYKSSHWAASLLFIFLYVFLAPTTPVSPDQYILTCTAEPNYVCTPIPKIPGHPNTWTSGGLLPACLATTDQLWSEKNSELF